ncbi:asparagine synthase-related protein [Sphingomonas sanxanigenens]|uniref:asparagine synthase (glutamine-hydrolyzing) n=1 Tax=Sphingomonas sanxanigenens DSM 19645 = NX02 TaxID=1123269 RepID=W0A8V3_9SPHN|nr:asparagine synthase-related protein [Sphingomonas sanxanigenens]AHE54354.1 hypothetical protein NX02_13290 [Sphingomonas sanxanigenens DSM 19645 = NX02]
MSGIAGIFHLQTAKPVDPDRVRAMTDAMRHRGPHGSGVWTARGIGLGHRRLSVIGVADAAAEPLTDPAGRLSVVCDGELLDQAPLRAELEGAGHALAGTGSAALILAAWQRWGEACLSRLEGSFAFAIHDAERQRLFLARDRMGAKPLHYALLSDGSLAFASELKGLLANRLLRRRPDPRAIEDFLALGHVPDDACLVDGVEKLAAGHCLLVTRGRPVPDARRWWSLDFTHRSERRAAGLQAEAAERLQAAVRRAMQADAPPGALIDGSADTAALVALMAAASPRAVATVAAGSGDSSGAGRAIALVAERFATGHVDAAVPADPMTLPDLLAQVFDEPFADPAAAATLQLAAAAGGSMTLALGVDGLDLLIAAEPRHRDHARLARLRALLPAGWREQAGRIGAGESAPSRLARRFGADGTLRAIAADPATLYAAAVAVTPPAQRASLYDTGMTSALQGHRAEQRYEDAVRAAAAREPLDRVQHADLAIAAPGKVLTRLDRAGMAFGVELRTPMLDPDIVRFTAQLPAGLRSAGMLRKALHRHLPADLPDRAGAVPQPARWPAAALADAVSALVRDPALTATGWFRPAAIAWLADQHRSGAADHAPLLWQLLLLDRSIRNLFGVGA